MPPSGLDLRLNKEKNFLYDFLANFVFTLM